jgi:hypothetical protein
MAEIIGFPKGGRQADRPVWNDDLTKSVEDRIVSWERMSAAADQEVPRARRRSKSSMHTLVFRSRDLILESDEADLIRDVCLDIHKAEVKLKKVRQRLQSVREWSAKQIESLTAADTKLTAAIVAALLSTREGKSDGS